MTNQEFAEETFGDNAGTTTAVAVVKEENNAVEQYDVLDFNINEQAESLLDSLDESNTDAIELTASYLNWEEIEPVQRLIFLGISIVQSTDPATGVIEEKRVAFFIDQNKNKWFSMATVILSELLLVKAPAPVEIKFKGKEKSKNGKTFHNFSIKILRPVQKLKA